MSCVSMDVSCPTTHCSHPAKRRGECCPTCNGWYILYINVFRCFCQIYVAYCHMSSSISFEVVFTVTVQVQDHYMCVCDLTECEYDRRVYADGKVFTPAGSVPCLQCRCKASPYGILQQKMSFTNRKCVYFCLLKMSNES